MGLDMYFFAARNDKPIQEIDTEDLEEVRYFRKFNNLHGWLEDLWFQKGNRDDMNCQLFELDEEDLNLMSKDSAAMGPMSGFFYGQQKEMDKTMIDEVKYLADELLLNLKQGNRIFYYAWW